MVSIPLSCCLGIVHTFMIHMALAGVLGIGIILSCQHASSLAAAVLHQWPTEILPTCSWTWPEKYFPPSVIYLFPPDDLSRFTGNCGASRSRRDKELELRLRHRFRHAIIQRGGPQPWKEDLLPTTYVVSVVGHAERCKEQDSAQDSCATRSRHGCPIPILPQLTRGRSGGSRHLFTRAQVCAYYVAYASPSHVCVICQGSSITIHTDY